MTRTTLNQAIEAADHPILLETAAQLSEAEMSWNRNDLLGIDTEFLRERTYRAELGLVQVSDGERAWLIDTVRLKDLSPLKRLLENPAVTKVLHSVSEDLEVLLNTVGALPEPLVDSQVACAMLGQPLQMGYHTAVNWLFDIEVDKEQTRSNWIRRPLTDRQLHYAAMDVVLLPHMMEELKTRLEALDRWEWVKEEAGNALATARHKPDPDTAYHRFSAAARLDGDSLRALRALAAWRERVAQERNRARGFVISDAGLLNLAKTRPDNVQKIRAVEDIHPGALRRYESKLLNVISGAAVDNRPLSHPRPLDNGQQRQLKEMRALVQNKAAELGVDPALLASRRELERLLRNGEGRELPRRFTGWRKTVITDDLLSTIR